ncbi:lytic transglycosylase domain-containing protein [Natranaerobius trueperi]|uniref:Lytic transglycosylase n=1 Tax=Natranaerobius trueperi TaxID=759412 RepID=A0A226BWH4_9FIRM|nr:lytic transglycosylase domain-containing protein [Natranaerobius trueperi]OWZ83315.1 lytic transglycosylase [Natranaerobius trueperi]
MKSSKYLFIILSLMLVITVIINLVIPKLWEMFYPLHYEQEIYHVSEKHDIDPYLLFSIIKVESKFDSKAVSNSGALGLMQIMPSTGAWAANEISIESFEYDDLLEHKTNLEIGAWYFDYLKNEFNDDLVKTLAAYNAGQGKVREWIETNVWDGTTEDIESIPYGETRSYIERVLLNYKRYEDIYSES